MIPIEKLKPSNPLPLPPQNQRIYEAARKSLLECTACFVYITLSSVFVIGSPLVFLLSTLGIVIFNTALRFLQTKLKTNNYLDRKIESWLPMSFAILDGYTRDSLVHELGHLTFAKALFKDSRPKIHLVPFFGGYTDFSLKNLSPIGKLLGKRVSTICAIGGGSLFSVLCSSFILALSHKANGATLKEYLQAISLTSIVDHLVFAVTAFWEKKNTYHDFAILWTLGIHPLVSIGLIILIPLITKCVLIFLDGYSLYSRASLPQKSAFAKIQNLSKYFFTLKNYQYLARGLSLPLLKNYFLR